jgi:Fe-S-cluster containining protein
MSFDFWRFFQAANAHLDTQPDQILSIHFREVDTFNCSRCAQCCTRPWAIGVNESFHKTWAEQFSQSPDPRFHDVFESVPMGAPSGHFAYLKKQPGSYRCVLLDDDNLCLAQKHFGQAAKPAGCQYYPHIWHKVAGGLKVSHLMQSCQSAPAYLLEDAELVYRVIPAQEAMSIDGTSFPILTMPGLYFSRDVLYLWLGLSLDTLFFEAESRSPLQNLRALNQALTQLIQLKQRHPESMVLSVAQMEAIHLNHRQWLAQQPAQLPLRTAFVIDWFLKNVPPTPGGEALSLFYAAILKGERLWPTLTPAEHGLLNRFLRNYLARKLLSMHQWFAHRVNLFQQELIFAALATLIQGHLLACRELLGCEINLQMLTETVNLVEGRLIQSYDWIETQAYHQMDVFSCLQETEKLLDLDLTVPSTVRRSSATLKRHF